MRLPPSLHCVPWTPSIVPRTTALTPGRPETEAEKRRRCAREAAMVAEARAELDAGLYVDAAEVDAWIDSIGTDHGCLHHLLGAADRRLLVDRSALPLLNPGGVQSVQITLRVRWSTPPRP